jgi:hypothetical protein
MGLLIIWVLPNTIALRHLFLIIGFISAIIIIVKSRFFSSVAIREILPLLLLGALFLWALIHFIFFPLNPELELKELKSIWARAFIGCIFAIGLSISLRLKKDLKPYFFISLFSVSVINLAAYLYLSYEEGKFLLPSEFVWRFTFKKIEAAFFGAITISIACANVVFILKEKIDTKKAISLSVWFFGIGIAIVSSVVANTKNGVSIALGLLILLSLTLIYKALFNRTSSRLGVVVSLVFVVLIGSAGWNAHFLTASVGWNNLLEDIQISSRIKEHNTWRVRSEDRNKEFGERLPINSRGVEVAGNTYERVAYAVKGLSLINQYPMGYGSINQSFLGLLNHFGTIHNIDGQTHSGWIDFGLAYGIPGLLILMLLFISIATKGLRSGDQFGLMGAWLVISFIPFGVIAEINYKHNFEILLFFIAFAAASTIRVNK